MSRFLHRYRFDPTGVSPSNLVEKEIRTLTTRAKRAIVPTYGAFFAKSLRIVDQLTNTPLDRGKHYVLGRLVSEAAMESGQEIFAVIIIIDPNVSNNVHLTYQAAGGVYEDLLPAIIEMLNVVVQDNRPQQYVAIENRPNDFTPVRHMHDIGDIKGFEPLVHAVERLRMAKELSSVLDHEGYYGYLDRLLANVADQGGQLIAEAMLQHQQDTSSHPQYILRTKVEEAIYTTKKPDGIAPVNNATGVARNPMFSLSPYANMYRSPQKAVQFQVSKRGDFATSIDLDITVQSATPSYQATAMLDASAKYFWRARYQADDLTWSDWCTTLSFTTRST